MKYKLPFKDYNRALKRNRLMGLKCNKCGAVTCPPMMVCNECTDTDLDLVQLSGRGRIVSFTTTNVAPEGRQNEVPYTIVLVELNEGPWIMGNLIDIDPDNITMEELMGKEVKLGNKVFPGDKYSAGPAARPLFSFVK